MSDYLGPRSAPSPFLYIGIESKDREFEAKLLLAAAAADRGLVVVLGQHVLLNRAIAGLVPGTFLVKGLNKVQTEALRHGGQRHLVAAINEEMLGVADPRLMAKDHDPDAARHCGLVFAQGAVHAAMLTERAGFAAERVVVTGNPRVDLLRPPFVEGINPAAERLRRRFGRFVLVNTNACAIHPAFGSNEDYFRLCVDIGWLDPEVPSDVADWRAHVEHDRLGDAAMVEAINGLAAALPDHAVVVRPHPSEDRTVWERRFAGRHRIHVLREGSHLPWMAAAEAILHTSCTSGVEAAIMGRPVVSLVPEGAPIGAWFLANHVNPIARTPAAAVAAVRRLTTGRPADDRGAERRQALHRHLHLEEPGFAFDRIAAVLAAAVADRTVMRGGRIAWPTATFDEAPERSDHARAKLTLEIEEIRDRFERFSRLLHRYGKVEVFEAWESLFVLARRGRLALPEDGRLFRVAG